jgi:hypothetical protein
MANIDNAASLSNRAMLATLKIRAWSGKASDREANDKMAASNGADATMTSVIKSLVNANALKPVQEVAREARAAFHENTAVWQDDGTRILLSKNFQAFDTQISKLRNDFVNVRDSFLGIYEREAGLAKTRLGNLARDTDYPSREKIAGKFSFYNNYRPISEASDWRVNLSEEQIAKLAQDTRAQTEAAMHAATNEGITKAIEALEKLAERMDAYQPADGENRAEGIFRDSLIANVISIAKTLPNLNISNDPRVDRAAQEMISRFLAMDPDVLRNSDTARAKAKADAEAVISSMKGIF